MTRLLPALSVLAALAAGSGCGPLFCVELDRCVDDDAPSPSEGFDTAAPVTDPLPDRADGFAPVEVRVRGVLPLIGDDLEVRGYTADGLLQAPELRLEFLDASFLDGSDPDAWCAVAWQLDPSLPHPSSTLPREWGAIMVGTPFEPEEVEVVGPCPEPVASLPSVEELALRARWSMVVGARHPERPGRGHGRPVGARREPAFRS